MSFERASVRACAMDVRDRPPRLASAPQCLTVAFAHCGSHSTPPAVSARLFRRIAAVNASLHRVCASLLRRRATQHSTRVATLCSGLQQRARQGSAVRSRRRLSGPRSVDVVDFADMLAVLPFCALSQLEIGPSPPAPMRTQRRPPRVLTGYRLSRSGTGTTGSVQSRRRCDREVLPTGTASVTHEVGAQVFSNITNYEAAHAYETDYLFRDGAPSRSSVPLSRFSVPLSRLSVPLSR